MGFLSDLTGKTSAKAATALGARNTAEINAGYTDANKLGWLGHQSEQNRLMPYAQQGQAGFTRYGDALGVNGRPAQQSAFDDFQSSPFLAYARQNSGNEINNIFKRYNAGGMGNSGASMLAVSRAAGERAQGDVNDYYNRMMGLGNVGLNVAGQQVQSDRFAYGGAADRALGRMQALTGNDTQATMAANNARMAGVNNVLKIAGGAAQLAMGMPPTSLGGGGTSPGGVPVGGTWSNPDYASGGYAADPRRPWG